MAGRSGEWSSDCFSPCRSGWRWSRLSGWRSERGCQYPDLASPWEPAEGRRAPVDRANYGTTAVLPFSGGTHAWLAAHTYLNRPEPNYAGAVTVLQGTKNGDPGPEAVWSQDSPGIRGTAERGGSFGSVIGD
jgi:hypothetical protein